MQVLGDYQLERPLGRGATAQVYLATHKVDGSRVALKVFHPGLWDQEDLRRRAVGEFETVASLHHPGIVRVLRPLWELDPPAVALEYVDGSSLEYAHGQGVTHRDLKPANILIGSNGRVLIRRLRPGARGGRLAAHAHGNDPGLA